MSLSAQKKLQERAQLISESRQLLERAENESRGMTAEENVNYEKMLAKIAELRADADRIERQESLEAELRATELQTETTTTTAATVEPRTKRGSDEYGKAFRNWIVGGEKALRTEEYRALQADIDTSGGFTVASEQFINRLIKNVDNMLAIRGLATVLTLTNAESLGIPTLSADPDDADWTSELGTGNEDSTMAFGKRALSPHPLAKRIKISRKLIRASAMDIESLVAQRLAYKFGVTQEKAFMTGSGAQQPLGVFTASNDGISTGRDVSTGNTSTSITFDGLKSAKGALKEQYRRSSALRWIFSQDAVTQISKLKDGEGRYLWSESVRVGEPDRILNVGVIESQYAPATFTSGLYVGIIGDFANYWIADALSMQMQRLEELYAATNQIGFIGRLETDGMPVLEEAFVRVKLG